MHIQIDSSSVLAFNISLVKQQQYLEALDRYKSLLNENSDLLATILIDLYKVLSTQHDNVHIRLIIVELYIKCNFFDDACIELEDMYQIDPSFSQTYFLIGKIYNKIKNTSFTCSFFQNAFDQGIRDSTIIDLLPTIYLDNQDIQSSINFFESLIKEETSYPHYNKALAELYRQMSCFEKSLSVYNNLIESHPQYLKDACLLCESILEAHPRLVFVREKLVLFYIKDCVPQKALFHVDSLKSINMSSFDSIHALFQSLLTIFSSDSDCIYSYIDFLISHECFTESLPEFEKLLPHVHLHQSFISSHIDRILDVNPHHAGIIFFSIKLYTGLQHFSKAFSIMLELLESHDSSELYDDIKSLCLSIWDKVDLEKDSLCYCIAFILYKQDKLMDALNYCNQASTENLNLIQLKGSILLAQEKSQEAQLYLTKHLKQFPYEKDLHLLAQKVHLHHAQIQHSQTSFNKLHDIFYYLLRRKIPHAIERSQQITADNSLYLSSQLLLTRSLIEDHNYFQALELLNHLIPFLKEKDPSFLSFTFFLQSICFYHTFQFDKASDSLSHIQGIDVAHSFCSSFQGILHSIPLSLNKGSAMTGLIQLHSDSIQLCAIQNTEEKTILSQGSIAMSFGLNHNNKGAEFCIKKNLISAESEFNIAIQLDPSLSISYANLGLLRALHSDFDQAEQLLDQGLSLSDSPDIYSCNKGLMYYLKGDFKNACGAFQHAIKCNPHNLHAQFNLAILYFIQNNVLLCFQYLQKLRPYGFFFIPIQQLFHYLEKDTFSLEYWINIKEHYEFETFIK
ncbi:hypothetical protein DID78_04655 [Candidatus Marinamargulisbacteria bacterium SCGC AG-343-D04]|nr:hypothetical protein DID78_04655 [Candidatus Marinamargulisbacteria bacterium SCGC AG-343-D04]